MESQSTYPINAKENLKKKDVGRWWGAAKGKINTTLDEKSFPLEGKADLYSKT